jgi:hypothetical protein
MDVECTAEKCLHKSKDDNQDACMFCVKNKKSENKLVDNSQVIREGGYF